MTPAFSCLHRTGEVYCRHDGAGSGADVRLVGHSSVALPWSILPPYVLSIEGDSSWIPHII